MVNGPFGQTSDGGYHGGGKRLADLSSQAPCDFFPCLANPWPVRVNHENPPTTNGPAPHHLAPTGCVSVSGPASSMAMRADHHDFPPTSLHSAEQAGRHSTIPHLNGFSPDTFSEVILPVVGVKAGRTQNAWGLPVTIGLPLWAREEGRGGAAVPRWIMPRQGVGRAHLAKPYRESSRYTPNSVASAHWARWMLTTIQPAFAVIHQPKHALCCLALSTDPVMPTPVSAHLIISPVSMPMPRRDR